MMSKVEMEDTDGMSLNMTIKAGDDTAMAGSEDCLHLAVFTPVVKQLYFKFRIFVQFPLRARRYT